MDIHVSTDNLVTLRKVFLPVEFISGTGDRLTVWMRDTGFASSNCHTQQHEVVLSVMREGAQRALQGDLGMVRMMAQELATWFPNHAQTMDAALALHLRSVGLDPATGIVHQPAQLPQQPLRGCGSAACSP